MSASPFTRLSRLTLQTPPRDPQCVVQDTPAGASDHDVLGFTPSTLQSPAEVEPAEAVVFSGSEQGVQGALPDELWAPFIQTHTAEPAADCDPTEQALQVPLKASPENSLAPQATQDEPCTTLPAAQHSPVVAQSPETQGPPEPCREVLPASHSKHLTEGVLYGMRADPMATVLVLAAQGVHESDAVSQYLPAGQSHAHSL